MRLLTVILLLCSYTAVCQVNENLSIEEITTALAQGNNDSVQLLFRRAQLYVQRGKYNSALADLELINSPYWPFELQITQFRILLLNELNRKKEAIQLCKQYIDIEPENADLHATLGEILLSMNDTDGALEQFTWLMEHQPDRPIGFIMHALIMVQTDRAEIARNDLAKLKQFDINTFNHLELAQASTTFNMLFEYDKAKMYATKAIQKNPTPQSYANLGWALWGLKSYSEAINPLTKSINLQPNFIAYLYRGHAYYGLNNYTKAESDLKTSLQLQPNLEAAYVLLGHIYKSRKNFKDACDCWEKALDIGNQDDVARDIKIHCK